MVRIWVGIAGFDEVDIHIEPALEFVILIYNLTKCIIAVRKSKGGYTKYWIKLLLNFGENISQNGATVWEQRSSLILGIFQ